MREVEAYRRFKCASHFILSSTLIYQQTSQHHSHPGKLFISLLRDPFLGLRRAKDSAIVQDPEADGKIVYLFLPVYKVPLLYCRSRARIELLLAG